MIGSEGVSRFDGIFRIREGDFRFLETQEALLDLLFRPTIAIHGGRAHEEGDKEGQMLYERSRDVLAKIGELGIVFTELHRFVVDSRNNIVLIPDRLAFNAKEGFFTLYYPDKDEPREVQLDSADRVFLCLLILGLGTPKGYFNFNEVHQILFYQKQYQEEKKSTILKKCREFGITEAELAQVFISVRGTTLALRTEYFQGEMEQLSQNEDEGIELYWNHTFSRFEVRNDGNLVYTETLFPADAYVFNAFLLSGNFTLNRGNLDKKIRETMRKAAEGGEEGAIGQSKEVKVATDQLRPLILHRINNALDELAKTCKTEPLKIKPNLSYKATEYTLYIPSSNRFTELA